MSLDFAVNQKLASDALLKIFHPYVLREIESNVKNVDIIILVA